MRLTISQCVSVMTILPVQEAEGGQAGHVPHGDAAAAHPRDHAGRALRGQLQHEQAAHHPQVSWALLTRCGLTAVTVSCQGGARELQQLPAAQLLRQRPHGGGVLRVRVPRQRRHGRHHGADGAPAAPASRWPALTVITFCRI